MNPPFPFEVILMFAFLSTMLLIGVLVRGKVKLVQKYLFPSSLIGGIVGLIIVNGKWFDIDPKIFEAFAFHFFNISFISIGLTPTTAEEQLNKAESKDSILGALWMALVQGVTFPIQAVIGGLFVILLGVFSYNLNDAFGFLLPLGFNEGPGEALSFGKVWETMGFQNAATVGISFATIGFLFAFFVGVPLVNWGIRKGLAKSGKDGELPQEFLKGFYSKDKEESIKMKSTMHPANVESLAFQFALVGLVYGVTYIFTILFAKVLPPDIGKMVWGFFFLFGMVFAILIRKVLSLFKVEHLLNVPLQRQITGFAVDYLIVATGSAIQIAVVSQFLLPITLISVTGGILTVFIILYYGKRLQSYNMERIAAIFGTVTGTVSTGLLLLRIVDPEFKTPVAREIGYMNIFAVPVIGTLTFVINGTFWWHLSTLVMTLIFLGIAILFVILIELFKLRKKPQF